MATVSLLTLRTRIREELGIELANEVLTDAEINARINASASKLYNRLVKADEDYFLVSDAFTLTTTTNTVTLPAHYKIRGLEYAISAASDLWEEVAPYGFAERNRQPRRGFHMYGTSTLKVMPLSLAAGSYRVWFIPSYFAVSSDGDLIEVIAGFDRLIVVEVCAWIRANKQMLDAGSFLQEAAKLEADIDTYAGNRLQLGPRVIKDMRPRWARSLPDRTDRDSY